MGTPVVPMATDSNNFAHKLLSTEYLLGYPRTLFQRINAASPTGTASETIYSNSLLAGTLAVNGDWLEIFYHGTFAANSNRKRVRLDFDTGTFIEIDTAGTDTSTSWFIQGRIQRESVEIARFSGMACTSSGLINVFKSEEYDIYDLTSSNHQLDLVVRAYTNNTDITAKGFGCTFHPASLIAFPSPYPLQSPYHEKGDSRMKIKLGDLARIAGRNQLNTSLPPLVKLVKDPVLRVRVRFKASMFYDQAQNFLKQHDVQLDEIKQKHGKFNENDKIWEYTEEEEAAATAEAQELLETEVDLVGDQISIDDLEPHIGAEQDPKFVLTGEDMLALRWLFSEYNEEPKRTGQTEAQKSKQEDSQTNAYWKEVRRILHLLLTTNFLMT